MPEANLHIAVFVYGYDMPGSGTQQRALTLAGAFSERGHRVDVVAVRASGRLRRDVSPRVRLLELGALATRLPARREFWRLMTYGSAPALARYLRRERPAVLLSSATHIHLAALWASRLARGGTALVLRESNQPPPGQTLSRFAYRFYRWADAVIANSDGVAKHVESTAPGLPRDRIATIYNPVVVREIGEQAHAPVDHAWFAPGAPPVVLGAGRLVPQKDFPTLLRAFARVRAARPARLVILGAGDRKPLAALADELGVSAAVDFAGFAANPFAYMARAAVFVLSSAWEGFPSVLIEALACGCPVVSTDCPSGPAEILQGGAYGPLVPVGDDAALADAILTVLAAPPDRERLQGRARAPAFSVDFAAERYLEVLRHACRRQRP